MLTSSPAAKQCAAVEKYVCPSDPSNAQPSVHPVGRDGEGRYRLYFRVVAA